MRLLVWLSRLPFAVLYGFSDILWLLTYYVIGYRKKVVTDNLRRSFPEKSTQELNLIARNFYRNLSDIALESLKILSITEKELRARIHITNPEVCLKYLNAGQPVIVMTSHLGNWEWLLSGNALQLGHEVDALYKKLTTPSFNALMLRIRSRFGPYPVEMKLIARELVKRKSVTRIIAMVADQTPFPEHAYWTEFLHQDTPFFTGAASIAQRTGYPVLYVGMRRVRRGYYETWFEPLAESPYTDADVPVIIEKFVRKVENDIRQYPDQWLWSHMRWKHKRSQSTPDAI